jgi:hypothetical protein
MSDQVVQDFARIVDAFKEMRDAMHQDQQYDTARLKAADVLYNAIRAFAPVIGCLPPYLPIEDGR